MPQLRDRRRKWNKYCEKDLLAKWIDRLAANLASKQTKRPLFTLLPMRLVRTLGYSTAMVVLHSNGDVTLGTIDGPSIGRATSPTKAGNELSAATLCRQ